MVALQVVPPAAVFSAAARAATSASTSLTSARRSAWKKRGGLEHFETKLIHGMSDDNVILDNATAFAAAMQRQARPFEMMLYPGQTHRVAGPGISEHLWTTILEFLDRRMPVKQ
jgi:hypothetical protein